MIKTSLIWLGAILLAAALVLAGFAVGATWSNQRTFGWGMGPGMMGVDPGGYGPVDDMMGRWGGPNGLWDQVDTGSSAAVVEAFEEYVEELGYSDLVLAEVMEFEENYYAIVAEKDTGIGAMELLIDRSSGAIGPEYGPNMMWNTRYGMMGEGSGMMGGYWRGDDENSLSLDGARQVAQRWLDENLPGRTTEEPDPFYGYYTLHFLNDGAIEGMLSVHGDTGEVWIHNWHGDFVATLEGHS